MVSYFIYRLIMFVIVFIYSVYTYTCMCIRKKKPRYPGIHNSAQKHILLAFSFPPKRPNKAHRPNLLELLEPSSRCPGSNREIGVSRNRIRSAALPFSRSHFFFPKTLGGGRRSSAFGRSQPAGLRLPGGRARPGWGCRVVGWGRQRRSGRGSADSCWAPPCAWRSVAACWALGAAKAGGTADVVGVLEHPPTVSCIL